MRIERAIEALHNAPDGWVRLESARWFRGGLALSFGIYRGQRGVRFDAWLVQCRQVREAKLTAQDGGGLRLYPASHPAARQFAARQGEVQWNGICDDTVLMGTLYNAHIKAVGDWIPFDSYSTIRATSKGKFSCRGPDFLMRAYAKSLRAIAKPQLILGRGKPNPARPRVLHFGDSYVVAVGFTAERRPDDG